MSLKETLQTDLKTAMRTGDTQKRDTLRMMMAAIKQVEIDTRTTLDETGVQAVLTQQAKQRRESMADYTKAGQPDRAEQEQIELNIIEAYLPQLMTREEILPLAQQAVQETGATDMKGMGQVMKVLMPQLQNKADGRLVNQVVKELLQNG